MISIMVNGETVTCAQKINTIASLIEQMGLGGKRIAVELNLAIIPRSLHAETQITEGDVVEVVQAIGGG